MRSHVPLAEIDRSVVEIDCFGSLRIRERRSRNGGKGSKDLRQGVVHKGRVGQSRCAAALVSRVVVARAERGEGVGSVERRSGRRMTQGVGDPAAPRRPSWAPRFCGERHDDSGEIGASVRSSRGSPTARVRPTSFASTATSDSSAARQALLVARRWRLS
jgi:hypothetical protein